MGRSVASTCTRAQHAAVFKTTLKKHNLLKPGKATAKSISKNAEFWRKLDALNGGLLLKRTVLKQALADTHATAKWKKKIADVAEWSEELSK